MMMGIPNFMGLFTVIPVAILLAVSFFVLVVVRKVDAEPLKAFGYVIAVILWVAVLLIMSLGIYEVSTGKHPVIQFMKESMDAPAQVR